MNVPAFNEYVLDRQRFTRRYLSERRTFHTFQLFLQRVIYIVTDDLRSLGACWCAFIFHPVATCDCRRPKGTKLFCVSVSGSLTTI